MPSLATALLAQHGATKRAAASVVSALHEAGMPTAQVEEEEEARCRGLEAALGGGTRAECVRYASIAATTLHAASARQAHVEALNDEALANVAAALDAHVAALRKQADLAEDHAHAADQKEVALSLIHI